MQISLVFVAWASLFFVLFTCVVTAEVVPTPLVSITGRGSSLPKYVTPDWIREYKIFSDNRNNVSYTTSTALDGEENVIRKQTEYGMTQGALDPVTYNNLKEPLFQFPIALLALGITYNIPGLEQPLNLTADQIAQIFQRQVKWWNDSIILATNPALNYAGPINLISRPDRAGTTLTFTRFLSKATSLWKLGVGKLVDWPVNDTIPVAHAGPEVAATAKIVGAVCYGFYGHIRDNNMPSARIKNKDGNFVSISTASVTAAAAIAVQSTRLPTGDENWDPVNLSWQPGANSWPITTYSVAMFYKDMTWATNGRGAAVVSFLSYLNTDAAQAILEKYHFAPMPIAFQTNNLNTLRSVILSNDGYKPSDFYTPSNLYPSLPSALPSPLASPSPSPSIIIPHSIHEAIHAGTIASLALLVGFALGIVGIIGISLYLHVAHH